MSTSFPLQIYYNYPWYSPITTRFIKFLFFKVYDKYSFKDVTPHSKRRGYPYESINF
jgi:hypothetical protein